MLAIPENGFIKLWSNLTFLVPAFCAVYFALYWYALVILTTMCISILYHYHDEHSFAELDIISANGLILCNWFACYIFGFAYPYFPVAVLFLIASVYFYIRQYMSHRLLYHALWHITSACITVCCVLGLGYAVLSTNF